MRQQQLAPLLDGVAGALRRIRLPSSVPGARLVLAGHVAARTWTNRAEDHAFRRALLQVGFMEATLRTFGRRGMFSEGESFYPLFLLPDFHGPHFDEALRRLLLPGRGPFAVHFAVTGMCPCRCSYCYASAGGTDAPDLGDERLFAVAEALARSGVPLVVLGGGEPLARFERALRLVENLALTAEVRLATSGVGLTAERATQLRQAGLTTLAVSLDSDDRAAVNSARGYRLAFDAAVDALGASIEAGLITFVTAVVDRSGFRSREQVDRFLSFIRSIHPRILVNFLPKFATGRAASTGGFSSPQEYAPIAKLIAETIEQRGHRATVFLDPLELLMGCVGGGRRQLHIDIRGNVTACISGAAFGNVVDESFDDICARFSAGGARLKRGFFCASVGERADGGGVLTADESFDALYAFYAAHPDTLFQRMLDAAGKQIAWLAES